MGRLFPPLLIARSHWGISTPIQYVVPWVHLTQYPKRHVISSDVFAQLPTATPFPLKIAPRHGGFGPSSNTRFLEHTQEHYPNGISIGSAVFAGLTTVTD